ncbi:hypothetical protein ABMA28_016493 [Loxostege sticticalis]|uniref:Cytadhesion n=1 Tax=Loxostege sticticalis TaxID=481309 RepID=A0ABD0T9B1_LOXSC
MEAINIIPVEFAKIIPLFDGNYRQLNLFIRKCEYILSLYQGGNEQMRYNMHVLTSRLTGDAAALVSEREDLETWDQLKTILTQHFGDPRSEECIAIKLETIKINPNERYLHFCNRIQSIRSNLFSKLNQLEDQALRESKIQIYNKTAMNVFLYNLPEDLIRVVKIKNPTTLEEALEIVLEEENFQLQYKLRNKQNSHMSNPRRNQTQNEHQVRNPNRNFRPNNIQPNLPHNSGYHSNRPHFNYQNRSMQQGNMQNMQRPFAPRNFYNNHGNQFRPMNHANRFHNNMNNQPVWNREQQSRPEPSAPPAPLNFYDTVPQTNEGNLNADQPAENKNFRINASVSTRK